jgi:hypothetical protein
MFIYQVSISAIALTLCLCIAAAAEPVPSKIYAPCRVDPNFRPYPNLSAWVTVMLPKVQRIRGTGRYEFCVSRRGRLSAPKVLSTSGKTSADLQLIKAAQLAAQEATSKRRFDLEKDFVLVIEFQENMIPAFFNRDAEGVHRVKPLP